MKKVFVYFDKAALCQNPSQAKEFINSLEGISCNEHTEKLLDDLFAGRKDFHGGDIRSLATTGCGRNRIRVYDALGETLQQHQEEHLRREAERHKRSEDERSRQIMARSANDRSKIKRLMERRPGTYETQITIWFYDHDPRSGHFPQSATEMTCRCIVEASCGAEAYAKTVQQIIESHDIADYVKMTDPRFEFKLRS